MRAQWEEKTTAFAMEGVEAEAAAEEDEATVAAIAVAKTERKKKERICADSPSPLAIH